MAVTTQTLICLLSTHFIETVCMVTPTRKNCHSDQDMSTPATDMTQPNYPTPCYHPTGHEIWTEHKTDFFRVLVTQCAACHPDRISKKCSVHTATSGTTAHLSACYTQLADPLHWLIDGCRSYGNNWGIHISMCAQKPGGYQ